MYIHIRVYLCIHPEGLSKPRTSTPFEKPTSVAVWFQARLVEGITPQGQRPNARRTRRDVQGLHVAASIDRGWSLKKDP